MTEANIIIFWPLLSIILKKTNNASKISINMIIFLSATKIQSEGDDPLNKSMS
jgi:hypothetical protein